VIELERPEAGVARVRLVDEAHMNALSLATLQELTTSLRELDASPEIRCIVLTGAGRAFSAGLNLQVIRDHLADPSLPGAHALQEQAVAGIMAPRQIATPVVAAVNGLALGGGLALALCCDIRISGSGARFTTGFPRLGLTGCDVGVSWMLPRLVGAANAFDLMLTSRVIDATEALRMGLVSQVVDDASLDGHAVAVAAEIAALAPFAVRLTKQAMWTNLAAPDLHTAIEVENRNQVLALQTEDVREGVEALTARRAPQFSGR
jgi:enoyl-CoA hydratase